MWTKRRGISGKESIDEVEPTQVLYNAVTHRMRHRNETANICETLQIKLVSIAFV